jgi:ribosomal protein L17|tara:strand:- start:2811 stop:3155 length:345 start_codon:yes stop_codon:yes gene_type:complete
MVKRNLLTSLLLYESVRTTKKRAAVIAPQVDKLINYAKTHSPHVAIRHINKTVTDTNASKKIMEVFIKRYAKKNSGLTRTVVAGFREGDGAQVVDLSLVEGEAVEAPTPTTPKK